MKKIILAAVFVSSLFGCAGGFTENDRYLNIKNNTDKTEFVRFGFSSNGIVLRAGKSTEIVCNGDRNTFCCSYGAMSFDALENDTTLEINTDCWYIGEEKHYYWTEGISR